MTAAQEAVARYQLALVTASRLNIDWDLKAEAGANAIVPFGDPSTEILEYCLHELTHATLLGVELGSNLSARLGEAIREMPSRDQKRNEAEVHVVVVEVLEGIGLPVELSTFYDAVQTQVFWQEERIVKFFEGFRKSPRFKLAVWAVQQEFTAQGARS